MGKQLTKYHNPSTTSFKRLLHQSKYAYEEFIVLLLSMSYSLICFPFLQFLASPLLAVKVQQPAPDFKGIAVLGNDFQDVQLSDYAGKYLVLFFYPLDL